MARPAAPAAALVLLLLLAAAAAPAAAVASPRGGAGASFAAPSFVGVWDAVASQAEYDAVDAKDRTGFLDDNGFTFAGTAQLPALSLTVQSGGAFTLSAASLPAPVEGQLRLYVCGQRGHLLTIGTSVDAANNNRSVYRQLLVQVFKRTSRSAPATYAAVQEVNPDGTPVAPGAGIGGTDGRYLFKLNEGASGGSPLTRQTAQAKTACGAFSFRA